MAFKLINREYGYKDTCICQYVCDNLMDLRELPHDCCIGSTALIISTGDTYMINSSGDWIRLRHL